MASFYSVQSPADAARLAAGGLPWPVGLQRANLGLGFYAWGLLTDAERYRTLLVGRGVAGLAIVEYEIADTALAAMTTLDLTLLSDEDVEAWMNQHSRYGAALPHDWNHVVRHTDKGVEHHFSATAFAQLKEAS